MPRFDAVLFDLLSALLDSWSLWNDVADSAKDGYRWRDRYLTLTAESGAYRDYETIVAEAAGEAGISDTAPRALFRRWASVRPWPEVPAILSALAGNCGLGVVTNCSVRLAEAAVPALTIPVGPVVTAEEVGWYKPHAAPYAAALDALDLAPERVLYVAGSPFDVVGADRAGMEVYWHNRRGIDHPDAARVARWVESTLAQVPIVVAGGETDVEGP